jgi:hypothetical protein
MTQSTDAILCYGISMDEDFDYESKFPEHCDEDGDFDKYALIDMLEEKFGCTLEIHCSCDYAMYILTIKDSVMRAYRGEPEVVTSLEVTPEWAKQLQEAKIYMGLENEEANWWLASLWC